MKPFTKTITKTYNTLWIHDNFTTYSEAYKAIRDEMSYRGDTCFKCDRKFEINEIISLGCFKEVGNKTLCAECAASLK